MVNESMLHFRPSPNTTSGHIAEPGATNLQDGNASSEHRRSSIKKHLTSLYLFTRPYTIIGSILQVTSISFLAVEAIDDMSTTFVIGLLKALAPIVLINIYVAGLNQLYDVELDKVNKPFLPLASGDLSMKAGITIVLATLLMSVGMGIMFQSPPILAAVLIPGLLGTTYSVDLPYLRWKKQPILTAISILITRAFIFPLASFTHMQKFVLGKPISIPISLVFTVAFTCVLAIAISVIKDIPDADGDKDFGIQTFSVTLGRERVFWLCVKMLLLAYAVAVAVGASSDFLPSELITVSGHCALALILWRKALSIDLNDNKSTLSFYMFIWKLFYAELLLIPFVR